MLLTAMHSLSLEGISHRANVKLFDDVTETFERIRNSSVKLSGRSKSRALLEPVEKLVKRHTNLQIRFKSDPNQGINAYVFPPHLDKNHPLLSDVHRQYYSNSDAKRRIKKAKSAIEGSIDLTTGKVDGVYTEIVSEVFVASQILQGSQFTSQEAAAIFLHEIGHLITYYEYLGRHTIINHVLEDIHKEYTESGTTKQRVELLEVVKKGLDLDDIDPELAAKTQNSETFRTLVVSELVQQTHSATDTKYYDLRTWEALADQYVSRLGGGRHLAMGLDKIHRIYGVQGYESNLMFLVTEALSVIFSIVFLPITILIFAFGGMPFDIYDPPKERLDRIRKDLVSAMKDSKIDKEYRKRLKDDVEAIDGLMKAIESRQNIMTKIWATVNPNLKKQFNRAKFIQELEEFKDNQLFVRYNTLKSME